MMFRSLLVVSSLLLALPAQRGEKRPPAPVPARPIQGGADLAEGPDGDLRTVDGKVVKLTPEQMANKGHRRGAASFCQFRVDTKPAKLMPGQTGKLLVTAILKGQAVLPSPAPLEVVSQGQQGMVTLGPASFQPAGMGRLAKAYVGRPVYDNYAIIEIPVTVDARAVVGQKYNVGVEMRFSLFDGQSAQSIGKFLDRAVGTVEVGQALDPAVRGGYTPPASSAPTGAGQVEPVGGNDTAVANTPPNAAVGAAPNIEAPAGPAPEAPAAAVGPTVTPQVEDDDNTLFILLAGGGVLAVAVLLLLLKRK